MMIAFGNFTRFLLTGLLLLGFTWMGFYFGSRHNGQSDLGTVFDSPAFAGTRLASTLDSAARGKALSLASGRVELNIDALYGLDHLTGDLSCWILNPVTGDVATTFVFNVRQALGVSGGEADYVLTTGVMDFSFPKSTGLRTAQSVVYVGEGNSGKVIGLVLLYDRQALSAGNPDSGELRPISAAMTRAAGARRDQ